MKVFFDTEFTGLRKDTDLISIGLISEDNKQFYGEIITIDYDKQDKWIVNNVLNKTIFYGSRPILDIISPPNYYYGDKEYIKEKLTEWLSQFEDVQLISDVCHYDMVLLIDIFGQEFNLPKNVSSVCYDINQDIAKYYKITDREAFDLSREAILDNNNIEIKGSKHNSFYDAKVIRAIYNIINR